MRKCDLPGLIDWPMVMAAPRYAGGHEDVMETIFGHNAEVVAQWREDDYQGMIIFAYRFADGSIAIISDLFGSCSGCDAWEGSNDTEAHNMIESLVNSARLFPTVCAAIAFCVTADQQPEQYLYRYSGELLPQLRALIGKVQP